MTTHWPEKSNLFPVQPRTYGGPLPNVTEIDRYGFYVPNNPHLTPEEIEFICDIINSEM